MGRKGTWECVDKIDIFALFSSFCMKASKASFTFLTQTVKH